MLKLEHKNSFACELHHIHCVTFCIIFRAVKIRHKSFLLHKSPVRKYLIVFLLYCDYIIEKYVLKMFKHEIQWLKMNTDTVKIDSLRELTNQ